MKSLRIISLLVCLLLSVSSGSMADGLVIAAAGGDTTPPNLLSATIPSAGTSISFVFDEAVSIGAGGNAGWSIDMDGDTGESLSYSSGDGTTTLVYSITGRTIYDTEAGTVSYIQPGDGLENDSEYDLASIPSFEVTNDSTQSATGGLALVATDSAHTTAQTAYLESGTVTPSGNDRLITLSVTNGVNAAPTCTYAGTETFTLSASAAFASNIFTYVYTIVPSAASGVIRVTPTSSTSASMTWHVWSGASSTIGVTSNNYVIGGTSITRSVTSTVADSQLITAATVNTDAITNDAVTNGSQDNYNKETSTTYLVSNLLTSTLLTTTVGAYSTGFSWTESSNSNIVVVEVSPAP